MRRAGVAPGPPPLLSPRRGYGARAYVAGARPVLRHGTRGSRVTAAAAALVARVAAARHLLPHTWRVLHPALCAPELQEAIEAAVGTRHAVAQAPPRPLDAADGHGGAPAPAPLAPLPLLSRASALPLLYARAVEGDNPAARTPAPLNYGVFTADDAGRVPPFAVLCEYMCVRLRLRACAFAPACADARAARCGVSFPPAAPQRRGVDCGGV
jgi:hypothetical protein